jgi:phospholipid/cholesterol/gamma-HCH transport system substrate-binding protein
MPSARRVSWAKFRVTVTASVALIILGVLAYLLTGGSLLQPKTTLRVYAPDASGLLTRSAARVNGIPVGKVRSIKLSGSRDPERIVEIAFTVELTHLRDIPEDSTAQISPENAVGDQFLDISKGPSPRKVKPGGEILYKSEPEMLKNLDIPQFEKNLRAIDALLADIETGRTRVGKFVVGDQMYRDVVRNVGELERGIYRAVDATTAAGELLYTDKAYRRIADPLRRFDRVLEEMQSGEGAAGRFLHDDAQYEELRGSLADLRRAVADIGSHPWLESDALYRRWNAQAAAWIGRMDELAANPALHSTELYEQLDGAGRELSDTFREVREHPDRFLRLKIF